MTREERAFEASKRFEESLTEKDIATLSKDDMCFAFQLGVKWADANPKSPWISVKDKLPCNEKYLIVEIIKGVELRTKKVGVLSIDGYIDISYMYSLQPHGWHWNTNDTITHWFPLPERPKKNR